MMIVIDYDAGNTANVLRALKNIGLEAELSADPDKIRRASGLILPGVGAFPAAMEELNQRQLVPAIKDAVAAGIPLLGICLGMQLLLEEGLEHQATKGLGLIPGTCRPLIPETGYPVPHMGWNTLQVEQVNPLTKDLAGESVYFVHSFFTDVPKEYLDVTASYSREIPAMISKGKVYGAQFHPEKSGEVGLDILRKFAQECQL